MHICWCYFRCNCCTTPSCMSSSSSLNEDFYINSAIQYDSPTLTSCTQCHTLLACCSNNNNILAAAVSCPWTLMAIPLLLGPVAKTVHPLILQQLFVVAHQKKQSVDQWLYNTVCWAKSTLNFISLSPSLRKTTTIQWLMIVLWFHCFRLWCKWHLLVLLSSAKWSIPIKYRHLWDQRSEVKPLPWTPHNATMT